MWTRGKEGGKQGGNWIGLKDEDILCRWKRGLEKSAAYQWTQSLKQKGKSNESKSQLSFFKK